MKQYPNIKKFNGVQKSYFVQDPPTITENPFGQDFYLRQILDRVLFEEKKAKKEIEKDLFQFAERTKSGGDLFSLSQSGREPNKLPYVKKFDGWGKQIDKIITCDEWKKLHDVASEEGLQRE